VIDPRRFARSLPSSSPPSPHIVFL
jgi:hypothetical protein